MVMLGLLCLSSSYSFYPIRVELDAGHVDKTAFSDGSFT